MNILFVNANLYGHINPTLGLVKRLTARGHHVSFFCSESFSDRVTEMGAAWIGYSGQLDSFLRDYRPTDRHPFFMLMEYMLLYDEVVLPEILDILKANPYDLIICDSYFGGVCFLKQMTQVPVVSSHSSFAMSHTPLPPRMLVPGFHQQLDHCYQIIRRICEKHQIMEPSLEEVFVSKGDLNIVYTTRSFNGDEGVDEPDYLFMGPSVDRVQAAGEVDFSVIGERKLIYISLGSLNNEFVDFYQICIAAFRDTNFYVCMSIGTKCDSSQLCEIPGNFLVQGFLPQLEILKQADLFITHAGFNSVNEALYFGVPMLALPQVNDQHMVARRLLAMHLGRMENLSELSPEILRAQAEALVLDRDIRRNCMRISLEMRNSTSSEKTVRELEKYVDASERGE